MRQHLKQCEGEKPDAENARPDGGTRVDRQTGLRLRRAAKRKWDSMKSEPIPKTIHHPLP